MTPAQPQPIPFTFAKPQSAYTAMIVAICNKTEHIVKILFLPSLVLVAPLQKIQGD